MNRRSFLSTVGGIAAGGLAGCVADDAGDAGTPTDSGTTSDDADTPDESETGTSEEPTPGNETATDGDETGTAPPSETGITLADSSLKIVDTGCGQQTDAAQVSFEQDATTVVVTGTIWGANTCKVPTLADVSYDAQADELTVAVATKNRDTDGTPACATCITELEYRATLSFEGGLPGSVSVTHDHGDDPSTVATATPS